MHALTGARLGAYMEEHMQRGGAVAQFGEEKSDTPLSLRITESLNDALTRAHEEEMKGPAGADLKKTRVGALIFSAGMALYWARHALGFERYARVRAAYGGNERQALEDLLSRGLESWEKEHGVTAEQGKPSKKGAK